ncbi:contractile injection system protein, VgrG/Pvc8 family, partial [Photorhabdus temperata]|uniref:contractile injection system protein, VgrG/Pvc8 family n=1 Tax=Photorhabdus temperata TaxID=574560 RepID=UPI0004CEFA8F
MNNATPAIIFDHSRYKLKVWKNTAPLDVVAYPCPKREQVMQYDEDDLRFVQRLLAEVGIWYKL